MKRLAGIVAVTVAIAGGAAAQESRMDWRWGRPGVLVVTNVPPTLTINGVPWWTGTNGAFGVEGVGGVESGVSAPGATNISTAVATALVGPLASRVSAVEARTNAWDTAVGWGDHAYLYRDIAWVPAVADVTGLQTALDGLATKAQVAALSNDVANLPPATVLEDSQDASYFETLENGTGTVSQVTGPFTNYYVVLSSDFMETQGNTRPSWVTNSVPYNDGDWYVNFSIELDFADMGYRDVALWAQPNTELPPFPFQLSPGENAGGAATLYAHVYYATNAVRTFADNATVQALRDEFDGYHPPTTDFIDIAAPRTLTLYGSLSVTNDTGYGAILATNPVARAAITNADPATGQVLASWQYSVPADRIAGLVTLTQGVHIASGAASMGLAATMAAYDSAGSLLYSNLVWSFSGSPVGVPTTTNIAGTAVLPSVAGGGIMRIALISTLGSTRDVTVRTGGSSPMILSVPYVPLAYATSAQLAAATDLTVTGTLILNGTNLGACTCGTIIPKRVFVGNSADVDNSTAWTPVSGYTLKTATTSNTVVELSENITRPCEITVYARIPSGAPTPMTINFCCTNGVWGSVPVATAVNYDAGVPIVFANSSAVFSGTFTYTPSVSGLPYARTWLCFRQSAFATAGSMRIYGVMVRYLVAE